jgi:carboxymethylenebutenolidase
MLALRHRREGEVAPGRAGEDIEYPADGDSVPAYLVAPPAGHGRGVLVMHEAWGLVDHIRDVCDRLAREGFVALAPDLFRGGVGADPAEAARLMGELSIPRVGADVDGAVAALLNDHRVDGGRVASVGFCMGGSLALFAGTRNPRVGAVVDFYGIFPDVSLDLAQLQAAVLGVFGSRDEFVSRDDVRKLELLLKAAGKRAIIKTLPGVGHAFMNDARSDRYDARAAAEGWDILLAFLRAELA